LNVVSKLIPNWGLLKHLILHTKQNNETQTNITTNKQTTNENKQKQNTIWESILTPPSKQPQFGIKFDTTFKLTFSYLSGYQGTSKDVDPLTHTHSPTDQQTRRHADTQTHSHTDPQTHRDPETQRPTDGFRTLGHVVIRLWLHGDPRPALPE
jgi:hypothetical protein